MRRYAGDARAIRHVVKHDRAGTDHDTAADAHVLHERRADPNVRSVSNDDATGKPCAGRQCLPQDGWIGAVQDVKHTIFGLEQALHRGRGKYEKGLKLTQMKQAHH